MWILFSCKENYNSCFILKTNLKILLSNHFIINIAVNLFTSWVRNIQIIIRFCMQVHVYILIRKVLISKAIYVKNVVYENIKMQKRGKQEERKKRIQLTQSLICIQRYKTSEQYFSRRVRLWNYSILSYFRISILQTT